MPKVLIVEDDEAIATIESDYLEASGIECEVAATGPLGLELGSTKAFDLVILDIMLPGMDGFEVCRRLREKTDVPIVMVTARQEDVDKILALGLGADDYIEKPFSPSVLVAFVKAHLARYDRLSSGHKKEREPEPIVTLGGIEVNTRTRRVTVQGNEAQLKPREYDLLLFLMLHPDTVFSKEALYERVWQAPALGDSATVAVHVNRLREKLEDDPANPRHIKTVWGVGYRFEP